MIHSRTNLLPGFDTLRLLGAISVLLSHSFLITQNTSGLSRCSFCSAVIKTLLASMVCSLFSSSEDFYWRDLFIAIQV
jgi:peptidoglycan/LPS O-acetylase OafA/YrhL